MFILPGPPRKSFPANGMKHDGRHPPCTRQCPPRLKARRVRAPKGWPAMRSGKAPAREVVEGLGGLVATAAIRAWMGTLDYRVWYEDPAIDPAYRGCQGQRIYVFWHEYILFPLYLRGHCNLVMLLSRHRDADILARVARHMGFQYVRGSTRRGGIAALRELLRTQRQKNLTITPDGPRGPRRHMAPGAVFLASRLGLPLVAMGFGYDRPWRVRRAWDQFAIPRPWSRARAVVSADLPIPANLDRHGLEHYRHEIETLLNRLCEEAEVWAESGQRRPGEVVFRAGPGQDLPQGPCRPPAPRGE